MCTPTVPSLHGLNNSDALIPEVVVTAAPEVDPQRLLFMLLYRGFYSYNAGTMDLSAVHPQA